MEKKKTKYYVLDKDLEIDLPIEIEARGSTQLKIDFYSNEVCLIETGDKRNFAAKLIRCQFEWLIQVGFEKFYGFYQLYI